METWSSGVTGMWNSRVMETWNSGVTGTWSSGLVVRRVKETMWLQFMCCALSNFSSFQFTRGWTGSYGTERKT